MWVVFHDARGLMKIKVLGTGCTTCNTAEAVIKEAVAMSGVDAQVIKVKDKSVFDSIEEIVIKGSLSGVAGNFLYSCIK